MERLEQLLVIMLIIEGEMIRIVMDGEKKTHIGMENVSGKRWENWRIRRYAEWRNFHELPFQLLQVTGRSFSCGWDQFEAQIVLIHIWDQTAGSSYLDPLFNNTDFNASEVIARSWWSLPTSELAHSSSIKGSPDAEGTVCSEYQKLNYRSCKASSEEWGSIRSHAHLPFLIFFVRELWWQEEKAIAVRGFQLMRINQAYEVL